MSRRKAVAGIDWADSADADNRTVRFWATKARAVGDPLRTSQATGSKGRPSDEGSVPISVLSDRLRPEAGIPVGSQQGKEDAKSNLSPTAWRMGQTDPKRPANAADLD